MYMKNIVIIVDIIITLLHNIRYKALCEIIRNKMQCKDIQNLSTSYQTSRLVAFRSVVIQFAPKSTAFSYSGMKSR